MSSSDRPGILGLGSIWKSLQCYRLMCFACNGSAIHTQHSGSYASVHLRARFEMGWDGSVRAENQCITSPHLKLFYNC